MKIRLKIVNFITAIAITIILARIGIIFPSLYLTTLLLTVFIPTIMRAIGLPILKIETKTDKKDE